MRKRTPESERDITRRDVGIEICRSLGVNNIGEALRSEPPSQCAQQEHSQQYKADDNEVYATQDAVQYGFIFGKHSGNILSNNKREGAEVVAMGGRR